MASDTLVLNDKPADRDALLRVSQFLDRVRTLAGGNTAASVETWNNFPTGAGIASSASAFAALALAASHAAGLSLSPKELSSLARTGSGSASRSVPPGFVEWHAGSSHETSYAESIAPPEHWALVDCIAIVSEGHKPTGSTQGHRGAPGSILQEARIQDSSRRLGVCRQSIQEKDFARFAEIVELDSHLMHAVMMTSSPPLMYWEPATLTVMQSVIEWRKEGLAACFTIDAGPNVHVICPGESSKEVQARLDSLPGVLKVMTASPGGGAYILEEPNS